MFNDKIWKQTICNFKINIGILIRINELFINAELFFNRFDLSSGTIKGEWKKYQFASRFKTLL